MPGELLRDPSHRELNFIDLGEEQAQCLLQ